MMSLLNPWSASFKDRAFIMDIPFSSKHALACFVRITLRRLEWPLPGAGTVCVLLVLVLLLLPVMGSATASSSSPEFQ